MDIVTRVAVEAAIRLALVDYRQRADQDLLTAQKAAVEAVAAMRVEIAELAAMVASKADIQSVYNRESADQRISAAVTVSSTGSQDSIRVLTENLTLASETLTQEIAALRDMTMQALATKIPADQWPALLQTAKAEAKEAARAAFVAASAELQEDIDTRASTHSPQLSGDVAINSRPLAMDRLASAWCPLPHADGALLLCFPGSYDGNGARWLDARGRAALELPPDFTWDASAGAFIVGSATGAAAPALRLTSQEVPVAEVRAAALFLRLPPASEDWDPETSSLPLLSADGELFTSVYAANGTLGHYGVTIEASAVAPLGGLGGAATAGTAGYAVVHLLGLALPVGAQTLEIGSARRASTSLRWPAGTRCGAVFLYDRRLSEAEVQRNVRWAQGYWAQATSAGT